MKLRKRAALIAVVTLCGSALANAATPDAAQDVPIQVVNVQQHHVVPTAQESAAPAPLSGEIVQPLPAEPETEEFATLHEAVAAQDAPAAIDSELNCLAIGVYFEAKGEPLAGQLAVAEVILNRTTSGRFPRSVCSVIVQPGQFSFIRGGRLPSPPANAQWRKALAVAQVAQKDLWESPVSNALFFHARYVSPGWKRERAGTVGNHIFYR